MSNHSGSSPQEAAFDHSAAATSEAALQAGLAALKRKDHAAAIAQLDAVYHSAARASVRLKAQIGLVKAYAQAQQHEKAIALCQPLCASSSESVRTWATQMLAQLAHRSPAALPPDQAVDPTGFQPLPAAPAAVDPAVDLQSQDITGFVPLSDGQSSEAIAAPVPAARRLTAAPRSASRLSLQESAAADSADGLATAPPEPAPDSSAAEPSALTVVQPIETTIQPPDTPPSWRMAGRAQKWGPLGPTDRAPLWAAIALTVVALVVLLRSLPSLLQQSLHWTALTLTFQQWELFSDPAQPTGVVLLLLIGLFLGSPWLFDWLLQRFYGLKSLSLGQLEQHSPEAVRLLKRVCGQRRQPLPRLKILATAAPLALTYGYLPQNARIAVSQGLLEQLADDEIAVVYAGEWAHIAHWDGAILSWVALVAQLPYLVYSQLATWADRQHQPLLRFVAVLGSGLGYGLYWLCRLPGLWLSRRRLYYSDRSATELTGNPNALVRALLKMALGVAQDVQRWGYTSYLLESMDMLTPLGCGALSLGSVYRQAPSPALLEWDRRNPYRPWLTLAHSHPPLGDRLNQLTLYARHWRLAAEIDWAVQGSSDPLSASPRTLLLQTLPYFGALVGLGVAGLLWLVGWIATQAGSLSIDWLWADASLLWGCVLIGFSVGLFVQINRVFPEIQRANLQSDPRLLALLSDPAAIPLDSQPVQFHGKLLGRRGCNNRFHQDLILQTQSGLIRLHYASAAGALGDLLLQSLSPIAVINRSVTVTGWFRRGATPWIDVDMIQAERGQILHSAHPILSTLLASVAALVGILIILQGGG